MDLSEIETQTTHHNNIIKQLFENTSQGLQMMNSAENELFRRVRDKAMREKEILAKIGLKIRERLEAVRAGGQFA